MIDLDPNSPVPTDRETGAAPPTHELFADGDSVDVDDPDAAVEVRAGAPATLNVELRGLHATQFEVASGRVAPGQTVRLRASEVTAYATKEAKRRAKDAKRQGATGGQPTAGRGFGGGPPTEKIDLRDRPATPAERRTLRWRVHCGGVWLPRPDARHPLVVAPVRVAVVNGARREFERQEMPPVLDGVGDEITLTLPAALTGQTLIVTAWSPGQEPAVNTQLALPVEGPHPAGHDVATADQIAAVMQRRLPVRTSQLGGEPARFLELCDWLVRLLPASGLSPLQQAHFLAQVYLETARMTLLREGPSGDALTAKHLKENDTDDGVPESTFRGRGLLQVTWAYNYRSYFRYIAGDRALALSRRELAARAPMLEQPEHAVRSALWFWSRPGATPAQAAASDNVWGASMRVNGFNKPSFIPNGYPERVGALLIAKRELGLLP